MNKEKVITVGGLLILIGIAGFLVGSRPIERQEPVALAPAEVAIPWAGMGAQLVEYGVIDEPAFRSLYPSRQESVDAVLSPNTDAPLVMTAENADMVLNALWAFGLANKNVILEEGPMVDPRYGGAGNFAATGGWSLAKGDPMQYYSEFPFVVLTDGQQALVEKVSKTIYRPCCDNPTYFPDCNHGMAMLGLLELLASQGASENELYQAALGAQRLWFPQQFAVVEQYLAIQGKIVKDLPVEELLGKEYFSASGYQRVLSEVKPKSAGGASCGV
ncbi:MAG: hypothetical protein COU11_03830 [Candidatus Harrisonbacteria bacterium CG10_big_fil_rev_8_21_14_0_10_49_15]|uniref:Uncharacterized protein n=1 Tax=Candidatus Harrisonbacteria bacterium CG10_big_fil_rev_8_21_14_0_10_49_15 TaxID=1974587 RepID=A0A2H0UK76_9BACT|nr:MAG: hypothetical protein COU11_03830 [Candidatus Harrisonbacteria bacterium CG10_big_fil_rev_8_21_14_0_10_49_15]